MTLENIFEIILGIVVLAFICVVIFGNKKTKAKKQTDSDIDEYINSEGEVITTHAEVIDLSCGTKVVGSKSLTATEWYVVTFKKDNGEIFELSVDSEMYEGFDVGMSGEVTTVNGQLNSFILD